MLLTRRVLHELLQRQFSIWHRESSSFQASAISKPTNILFFGTDCYSITTLKRILHNRNLQKLYIDRLGICSMFSGQSCELAKFVRKQREFGGSFHLHDYSKMSFDETEQYDVGLIASFGSLLPDELIRSMKYGIICIHPSLLPKWRGAAPLPRTILNGDTETGVTLIRILPDKFDVGPIIAQESQPVPPAATSRSLGTFLFQRGVDLFCDVVKDIDSTFLNAIPQSDQNATYAKKIKTKETRINWTLSTLQIDRIFRALHEDFSLTASWAGKTIRVGDFVSPSVMDELKVDSLRSEAASPGDIFFHKKRNLLCVKCADGWVGIGGVGIPERKPMTGKDFYNGFLSPDKHGVKSFS